MNTQTLLNNVATTTNNDAIIVNAKEFLKALRFVAVAVSTKKSRPVLQYVHVEIHENELTVEATDSHVLAQQKVAASISDKLAGKEFLIDGKFAKNLSKTTTKHGTHLFITPEFRTNNEPTGKVTILDGNEETFIDDNSDNDIFTRVKAFYPELDNLIPDNAWFEFETRKKELLPILKALKKKTDAKGFYDVHLEIQDNSKVVIGVDDDIQEIKHRNLFIGDKYKVENNKGLNLEIDFNVKLLISELQKCENTEFLKFSFTGMLRPFTFTRENGGIGLVAPLRTF